MRALSLTQPWLGLVAAGVKTVENRSRPMIKREDFGKPFALHATRQVDQGVYAMIGRAFPELLSEPEQPWCRLSRITSAVVATAVIEEAWYIGGCSREYIAEMCAKRGRADQARWTFGPTVYVLRDIVALADPVKCPGARAFWYLPADVEERVVAQMARAA